jgi:hypothetical protein
MKKRIIFAGVAGVSIAAALAAKSRNDLVSARDRARAAYAELAQAFARRRELVLPALASVRGTFSAADYERQSAILTNLVESNFHVGSEAVLTRALLGFYAVAARYEQALATNRNYLELREQLEAEASDIARARTQYLACAREYNRAREQQPASLVARLTGLLPEEGMDIGED